MLVNALKIQICEQIIEIRLYGKNKYIADRRRHHFEDLRHLLPYTRSTDMEPPPKFFNSKQFIRPLQKRLQVTITLAMMSLKSLPGNPIEGEG